MRLFDSLMAPILLLERIRMTPPENVDRGQAIPPAPPDWRSVRDKGADRMKTQALVHVRYFAGGN